MSIVNNPWSLSSFTSSGGEPDLRQVFRSFIFGTGPGSVPKGTYFIIRHMRTDEKGTRISCTCRTDGQQEAAQNVGHLCRFCGGEGYLWDDTLIKGYLSWEYPQEDVSRGRPFGRWSPEAPVLYLEYNSEIAVHDRILEPEKDFEGNLINPLQTESRYAVVAVHKMRGDRGRIEYIRVRLGEVHKNAT